MKKKRILAVDDNINATRIIKLNLERTGRYEVRELNDPSQALVVAQEFRPDLILLDVCMPDIEGSEVAEEFNDHPDFATTPIVFVTSIVTPREANRNGTLVIGRHEYIAKPARPETILACIERHLVRDAQKSPSAEYTSHA